ncbi:MAG TPA: hypothetical protein VK011_04960 [Acidimicrobiia bacterium]|nr:hypothetical protein [Acidimicrobiia bacterium]
MSRHMWASQANLRGVFGSQEGAVEVFGAAFGFVAGQCVPVDDGGEVGPVVVVGGGGTGIQVPAGEFGEGFASPCRRRA